MASSVRSLISLVSSKNGTKTDPRGGRPRPSIRAESSRLPRRDTTRTGSPVLRPSCCRVYGIHFDVGLGHCLVQLRHSLGHRAGMPVLQHPAGTQPHRVFVVGRLRRRMIRAQPEGRLLAVRRRLVELHALALLNIRIDSGGVAIASLGAVHHRPKLAASGNVLLVGAEVMPRAQGEFCDTPRTSVRASRPRARGRDFRTPYAWRPR